MPGLFGYIGVDPGSGERLVQGAAAVWEGIEWQSVSAGILGAHSHGGTPVKVDPAGAIRLVDGEAAAYYPNDPSGTIPGTTAEYRPDGRLEIVTDAAGAFPLYFAETKGGVVFSSLQRVLAKAVQAVPDPVGCLEMARFGATLAGRSCFRGIRRLLPGQQLRYERGRGVTLREGSTLWTEEIDLSMEDAAERAWRLLTEGTVNGVPAEGRVALMMSAGWDSRTLLALMIDAGLRDRLVCYSHGDLRSRELALAAEIVSTTGVRHHKEAIDERIFSEGLTDTAFARTECLIFAHWSRAGAILREAGIDIGVSGVYGGVLGGHYGPSTVMDQRNKMVYVLRQLVGRPARLTSGDVERLLFLPAGSRPWYVDPSAFSDSEYCSAINEDIEASLERLRERGVRGPEMLIEAFLVESRGAQYMNGQNLALRAFIDVANPFAASGPLRLAAGLSIRTKIHNRINRSLLIKHAPDLVHFPMAATLVHARRPLLIQEVSRLTRKLAEGGRRRLGWTDSERPSLGWVNFGFMRSKSLLDRLRGRIASDLWNQKALRRRVNALAENGKLDECHPMFDQLGKLMTADRLIN